MLVILCAPALLAPTISNAHSAGKSWTYPQLRCADGGGGKKMLSGAGGYHICLNPIEDDLNCFFAPPGDV
ncbi:hypothetical protein [Sinorhizobium americanum]|uniref:Uncharacterized protein n=2 Tax=Sinorhizobium americanum TaxID=194963 RepID=A0A1L3LVI6_9HYPH|nr:hypothetical protein [Sinorhizobium americanum]APG94082.1 hypothetical protein SAMCFNEI73_pC0360 [Sinorhizobium americanum]OAP41857.1 hypothetical protein ATC00_05570 [Sinorhizobium americanum]